MVTWERVLCFNWPITELIRAQKTAFDVETTGPFRLDNSAVLCAALFTQTIQAIECFLDNKSVSNIYSTFHWLNQTSCYLSAFYPLKPGAG